MRKSRRYIIGALIIAGALAYIIYGGMQQAMVYFVTPTELRAKERTSTDKFLRMGGMVVKGSLQKDLKKLNYHFELTDGKTAIPVFFHGVPPDLFADGKGAVVEGRLDGDGVFQASTIMAKHAEQYSPPPAGQTSYPHTFVPSKDQAKK
jgi:cytochrome c-type biogenesis protein CcmE